MTDYADFMLNETIGLFGFDDDLTAEIVQKLDALREGEIVEESAA